jgi:hypothetical protein
MKKSSGSGLEVQKQGIYLTKKWYDKFNNNYNGNYQGFVNNYMQLKQNGIFFPPPSYKLPTYDFHFSFQEANIAKSKAEQNQNNNNNMMSNNNNNFINEEKDSPFNANDDIPPNDNPNLNNFFNPVQSNVKDNRNDEQQNNGFPKIEDDENENKEYNNKNIYCDDMATPNPYDDYKTENILPKNLGDDEPKNENEDNIENKNMAYPSYNDRQKMGAENINNYGQNSGGTPTGDYSDNPYENNNNCANSNPYDDKKENDYDNNFVTPLNSKNYKPDNNYIKS